MTIIIQAVSKDFFQSSWAHLARSGQVIFHEAHPDTTCTPEAVRRQICARPARGAVQYGDVRYTWAQEATD